MEMYEKLQAMLDSHPSTAPNCEALMEILQILFSPEEAHVALAMSFKARDVADIARDASLSEEKTKSLLEQMARKAIIFSKKKGEKIQYGLVPTIPGLFEFPFMKGKTSPTHEKLAKLWEQYHQMNFYPGISVCAESFYLSDTRPASIRIITVENCIKR